MYEGEGQKKFPIAGNYIKHSIYYIAIYRLSYGLGKPIQVRQEHNKRNKTKS